MAKGPARKPAAAKARGGVAKSRPARVAKNVVMLAARNTSTALRKGLYRSFSEGSSKFTPCNVLKEALAIDKVLTSDEKGSMSPAVVVLGRFPMEFHEASGVRGLRNEKIAIKASLESNDPEDNSLQIERLAYELVSNPLLFNMNTPNVMLYVGHVTCRNWKKYMGGINHGKDLMKELNAIAKAKQKAVKASQVNLLILEQGSGDPFDKFVAAHGSELTPSAFWVPMLFQLVYGLKCFEEVGFAQNDMHDGNIWIDVLPQPVTFYYRTSAKGAPHAVRSKYMLKFFDYDRGSKRATKYNPASWVNIYLDGEMCETTGQCNDTPRFFDAFNILYNIYNTSLDACSAHTKREVRNWIKSFIDPALLERKWAWGGHLCVCVNPANWERQEPVGPTTPSKGSPVKDEDDSEGGCEMCVPYKGFEKRDVLMEMLNSGFKSLRIDKYAAEYAGQDIWALPSLS